LTAKVAQRPALAFSIAGLSTNQNESSRILPYLYHGASHICDQPFLQSCIMTIAVAEIEVDPHLLVSKLVVRGPESLQNHVADMVRSVRTPTPYAGSHDSNGVYHFVRGHGHVSVCLATALNWIEDNGWTVFHISCVQAPDDDYKKTWTYTFKKISATVNN
jgi:hypothetical protein